MGPAAAVPTADGWAAGTEDRPAAAPPGGRPAVAAAADAAVAAADTGQLITVGPRPVHHRPSSGRRPAVIRPSSGGRGIRRESSAGCPFSLMSFSLCLPRRCPLSW
ncbi:hypothetical protein FFZ77_26875 [Streptomyces katsurahamanus]|uniref:Uncharacterized protein n=1 Tax=Streptomyces katsurahamanus TaxID=2577098 RepID=A0ABW9P0L5_9ACTN|nr:hypothetical protein [Streptomyces katsurahamanus]